VVQPRPKRVEKKSLNSSIIAICETGLSKQDAIKHHLKVDSLIVIGNFKYFGMSIIMWHKIGEYGQCLKCDTK